MQMISSEVGIEAVVGGPTSKTLPVPCPDNQCLSGQMAWQLHEQHRRKGSEITMPQPLLSRTPGLVHGALALCPSAQGAGGRIVYQHDAAL